MSLLSLEKYLYRSRTSSEAEASPVAEAASAGGYVELSTRLVSAVRRSVFSGESLSDLAEELEAVRKDLNSVGESTAASKIAGRVEALLETFQARVRDANHERTVNFRKVLDILDETFKHLNAGTEKSRTRLSQVEENLSRAVKVDNLQTLRGHLGKMIEYVRRESRQDREARPQIESLGQQVRHAHASGSQFCLELPGRAEALEALKAGLGGSAKANLQVGLFTADCLGALRARHGDKIANNILDDLGRQHIQPLVPNANVFCWSSNSVLMLWEHQGASQAPGEVSNRLKSPFEHHAFVGTRVATFNIVVRSLVMPATGSAEEVAGELDRFGKAGAAC